jgi:predicted kinase
MIVLMAGLPGTGKSTLAEELARQTAGRILGKDEFRKAIFRAHEIEYSSRQDDFVMHSMLDTAEYFLARDRERLIFLDGRPFSRRYQIENVVARAQRLEQPWHILECICSDQVARLRLEADLKNQSHPAGNRDFDLYLQVKERFEQIVHPKTIVDTEQPFERSVASALEALKRARTPV